MGAGDDVFQWNPGDGNDTLEGQDGVDTMLFFGANIAENINVAANGGRVLFFRDIAVGDDGPRTTSRASTSSALGGADNIVVGDLSGTDLTQAGLDLRGPNGGGDGAADTVTVNGTNGDDVFGAAGDAGGINVFGLPGRGQRLLPGAGERPADAQWPRRRGQRECYLAGGRRHPAHDERRPRRRRASSAARVTTWSTAATATTLALMGAGDDTFAWNPGDDNDTLEGQDGFDTMLFNGAAIAENITVFGERRTGELLPRHRVGDDGPERRRGHRPQRARRCRHDRR